MASVEWSDEALDDLDAFGSVAARRIAAKVMWFGENFDQIPMQRLHHDLRKLYKLRIGDYRVMYFIQSGNIMIEAVRHRSEAYE